MKCSDIISAAYKRSTSNDADVLASDAELIAVIDRRLKILFSGASRFNPHYFGKVASVAHVAGPPAGWPLPADAEMVVRVEDASGVEVSVVPFDDRAMEFPPRVFAFGQLYRSAGEAGDPTDGPLTFYYSRTPTPLAPDLPADHASNTIDAMWPEQFADLLVLHVAKYLATKDDARPDTQHLVAEEAALLDAFARHIAHVNYVTKSRFGHRARMVAPGPESFGAG